VKVIVNANIVFSVILNSKGKIGDLLINSRKYLKFIAPDFLRIEIYKHYLSINVIAFLKKRVYTPCVTSNFYTRAVIQNEYFYF